MTFDPFCYLSLPFPVEAGTTADDLTTLSECLDLFTSSESLSEADAWYAIGCTVCSGDAYVRFRVAGAGIAPSVISCSRRRRSSTCGGYPSCSLYISSGFRCRTRKSKRSSTSLPRMVHVVYTTVRVSRALVNLFWAWGNIFYEPSLGVNRQT